MDNQLAILLDAFITSISPTIIDAIALAHLTCTFVYGYLNF
jgi:hypothetical protein